MHNNTEGTMTPEDLLKWIGIRHCCEYIETAKEKVEWLISIENKVGNLTTEDMALVYMSKRYSAFHLIGMGFEILYKTSILMEGRSPTWTHKITILHGELDASREGFSKIIAKYKWERDKDFTSYLDKYFTDPSIKYFSGYFDLKHGYQHPLRLIELFYELLHFVVDNANRNKVPKPSGWTPPIRFLTKP